MNRFRSPLALCALLALAISASAESLTGTVTNGTTGKPAAGDQVTLITLAQGMQEAGSTKTDSQGKFSLVLDNTDGPHLVRATHQGVSYFRMAPPGTTSVDVQVFDAAKKVDGISYTVDLIKLQTEGDQLQITRLFAVDNRSAPARTLMNDAPFEFYLPEGAQIDSSTAKAPGSSSREVKTPVKSQGSNRYAFSFPLRPGESQLTVSYHLRYPGSVSIDPKSLYPLGHLVVVMPKSMQFEPATPGVFQDMPNAPGGDAAQVQVAQQTQPGQALVFRISGTGTLPPERDASAGEGGGEQTGTMPGRPGGGIGAPIQSPDPLGNVSWYILGGFAVLLAAGGFYVTYRGRNTAASAGTTAAIDPTVPADFAALRAQSMSRPADRAPSPAATATPAANSNLLQVLKDELFQLELDRQQGRISPEEYAKHKTALDHTLERALKRMSM